MNTSSSGSSPCIFNPLQIALYTICREEEVCGISPTKPSFFKVSFVSLHTVLLMLRPSLDMLNNLSRGKPVSLIPWWIFSEVSILEALPKKIKVNYLETTCFLSLLPYLVSTSNCFLFTFVVASWNIDVYPASQFLISFAVFVKYTWAESIWYNIRRLSSPSWSWQEIFQGNICSNSLPILSHDLENNQAQQLSACMVLLQTWPDQLQNLWKLTLFHESRWVARSALMAPHKKYVE